MTYRGHQKAIASLLAALGLGGAGYGTHTYINYNHISPTSLATRLHDATSIIHVPRFTAVPESNKYTTDANLSETEVLIEIESLPTIPPNTAFRKRGFGGPLLRPSIIVGLASLLFPAARNAGGLGWVTCGLGLLALLYTVFQTQNAKYLRNWFITQHAMQDTQTQTDEKHIEIASLKSDLNAAQSMIGAIHQVVDPESTSSKTKTLDLVRQCERRRKLSDKQHRDTASQLEKNIVGGNTNHEKAENRIRMLEESNRELEGDLNRSEDEIGRLIEQREIDMANFKRKKEHYKLVAHYVVSANEAAKITEQTTEDSLQKRLREVMVDHNGNLETLQQDNELLRTKLAIASQHQEGMSQKLAKFDQETIQQNMAIEAEVKRLRQNENAQLLRTQRLEDASAERERKLKDRLEKMQNEKMMEVKGYEMKIRALREEMKTFEDEKNVALGNLQKHVQELEWNLDEGTQEIHTPINTAKTENELLKSSMPASLQKEGALKKTNMELQECLQKLEIESSKKLGDKETQLQKERVKYDNLVAWVKSKVKKPLLEDTTKHLANENDEFKPRSRASRTTRQGARPQTVQADNGDSHPRNMETLQADSTTTRPEQQGALALQEGFVSPIYAPDSPTHAPRSPSDQPTDSRSQDVRVVDDSASQVQQERPAKLKAQVDDSSRENVGSSFTTTQNPAVDSANFTQKQPIFTMLSTNIPGLHPTVPQAEPAGNMPASGLLYPTDPLPILLKFNPVDFTTSVSAVPQAAEQSPHSTSAHQFTSTFPVEPRYIEPVTQGRRSTEAGIGARRKLQPRRRNQTINNLRQTTPRSQSTLQRDQQALSAAMAPPPAAPTHQPITEQARSPGGAQSLNAPSARPNVFEGKTFGKCVFPLSRIC